MEGPLPTLLRFPTNIVLLVILISVAKLKQVPTAQFSKWIYYFDTFRSVTSQPIIWYAPLMDSAENKVLRSFLQIYNDYEGGITSAMTKDRGYLANCKHAPTHQFQLVSRKVIFSRSATSFGTWWQPPFGHPSVSHLVRSFKRITETMKDGL